MKKIHFKVLKLNKVIVNAIILLIIGVVTVASFLVDNTVNVSMPEGLYYKGDTASNHVSLMVNVYWGDEYIDDMLEIFDKEDIKTTFFIGGTWAVMNEDILKKIHNRGHEIANHGYNHKKHNKLTEKDNIKEIETTHRIVKELLNIDMQLFAPPSGAYNKKTVETANKIGYKTIMWTRDTIDWRDHNQKLIYERAVKNAHGGDLILMHPTKETLEALPNIINYLKNNNFTLTNVSENIGFKAL